MAFENAPRGWLNGVQAGSADIEVNAITTEHIVAGAVTADSIGLSCRNETGSPITAGSLVYVSGWNVTEDLPLVALADADVAGALAQWIVDADIADAANGTAVKRYRLTAIDTSAAGAAGDAVYLSTTAGTWTLSAPTGGDDCVQRVGWVVVDDAAIGEIELNLSNAQLQKIASNEIQSLAVTSGKINDSAVSSAKIDPNVIQYAAVQITNSQLKALRASPVQLVAAPGSARIIEFLHAQLTLDAGANVLTEAADNLAIKYVNGSGAQVSEDIECTGFIDQAGDTMTTAVPRKDVIVAKADCEDQVLCLHNIGGAEFAGNAANDALLYVHVAYKVVNSNW